MTNKKILKLSTITIPLTVLTLALFTFAIPASASDLCGTTVTSDITLTHDLVCAGTSGLIIGADDVKIELNGFTISGTTCAFCHGIRNGDFAFTTNTSPTFGFNDVEILGPGTISGFEQGIRGDTVKGFTIKNLFVTGQTSSNAIDILASESVVIEGVFISLAGPGSPEAIRFQNVDDVKVENVHVSGGAVGVNFGCGMCDGSETPTNGLIKDSTFVNNGNGILLAQTTDAKVENNVVSGSVGTAVLVGLECFIGSFPPVTNVLLSGNVVLNNDSSGITLCNADNSKVEKNTTTGNGGSGIRLLGSDDNEILLSISGGNTAADMLQDAASTSNDWKDNTCLTKSEAGDGPIDCV